MENLNKLTSDLPTPPSSPRLGMLQREELPLTTDISTAKAKPDTISSSLAMISQPEQANGLSDLQEARSSARALLDTLKEENSPLAPAEESIARCLRVTAQLAQEYTASQNNVNGQMVTSVRREDISALVECLDALQIYQADNVNRSLGERSRVELDRIKARLSAQLDKLAGSTRQQYDGYASTGYQNLQAYGGPHPFTPQFPQMQPNFPTWGPQFPQGNYKANKDSYNTTGNRTSDSNNTRTSYVNNGPSVQAGRDFHGVNGVQTNNNYGAPPYGMGYPGGNPYPGMYQQPGMGPYGSGGPAPPWGANPGNGSGTPYQ